MNFDQARFNMIEQQIRPANVLNIAVLDLLASLPREQFVPENYLSLAYMDTEIPLPQAQSMLSPKIEARLVESLNLTLLDNVYLVGAGTGYVAALVARLAQHVIAVENRAELAAMARHNLRKAGINNVNVVDGNGLLGMPEQGPFSAILLCGSVAEVPNVLLNQLKPEGRLLAIVGQEPIMQAWLINKNAQGHLTRKALFDTVIPPLDGVLPSSTFVL